MFRVTVVLGLLLGSAGVLAQPIDPTQPPVNLRPATTADAPAALQLQAIFHGAYGSRAVISGQRLRTGEEIAGARLVAIYPSSVLIERQGQRELLRLAEPVMKPSR
ncbi:type II secretion system protein N [Aquipseudomonas ullengensis]|uniref:type II secretion system protein N n=1 Tax=Aquipseudomonas ullengensis TaxID=2759166 RepID=UPI002E2A1123|nr:type II secretion system protein N [Pseudomonas ullengensis]